MTAKCVLGRSLGGGREGSVGMFELSCESVRLQRCDVTCTVSGLLFAGWRVGGCIISNLDRRLHIPRGVPGVDF